MSSYLTPLEVCQKLIGPLDRLAHIAGVTAKSPYHWKRPSKTRAAGHLPPNVLVAMLAHVEGRRLPVTARDLVLGMSEDEMEQRISALQMSQAAE